VPEFLQSPDIVNNMTMAQASDALRQGGFARLQAALNNPDPNYGLGPLPSAHPVVVEPTERMPTYQNAFITQVGVIWEKLKYRWKQFVESRRPPAGLFVQPPLDINWADVPDDVMLKYKILVQWDKLQMSDMPLEYFEFLWMLKQEQFGYSPEPPLRYEEIGS